VVCRFSQKDVGLSWTIEKPPNRSHSEVGVLRSSHVGAVGGVDFSRTSRFLTPQAIFIVVPIFLRVLSCGLRGSEKSELDSREGIGLIDEMQKGWLAVAILVLALVIFVGVRQAGNGGGEDGGSSAKGSQPTKSQAALAAARTATRSGNALNGPVRLTPSPGVEPSENFPEYQTHEPEQLGECFLPPLTAENVTLREAVQLILQSYIDVCTVTKQEPLVLSLHIPEGLDERMDIELAGGSVTSMLMKVGLRLGLICEQNRGALTYRPIGGSYELNAKGLTSQSWEVGPDFRRELSELLNPSPGSENLSLSVEEAFAVLGYPSGEGSPVWLETANSNLNFVGRPSDLDAVDRLVNILRESNTATMFGTSQVMISSPKPVPGIAERLRAGESQSVLRELASIEGASLRRLPEVTMRPGENATVEVIREVLRPDGTDFLVDWVGIRALSSASRYGFGVQQTTNFEARPRDAVQGGSHGDLNIPVEHSQQFESQEPGPARSSFLQVQEADDGTQLYVVTSSEIVDESGQFYDPLAQNEPEN
jgi:hypothetical protein